MKKIIYFLPAIFICFMLMTGQKSPEAEKWNLTLPSNIYDPSVRVTSPLPQVYEYNNPNTENRIVRTPNEVLVIAPNVRVLPRSNSYQSELIITRHPLNPLIMFGSSNAFNNTGTLFISEGVYVTTNGGANWFGSDTMSLSNGTPVLNQGGDPGIAIDKNGTFIQTHLGYTTSGMFGNYSTDNGATWSANFVITTGSQDKNLATTDDAPSSPYYGRTYVAWSLFNLTNPPVGVSYTSNSGVSWSAPIQVNTSVSGHYSQGTDLRVGPNGEVYVVWAAPISGSPYTEDFLGFAKSTNGGVNWTVTDNAYDMNGIRGTFASKSGIRVNGFPRIDVDRTGGPRNGWIYVVSSEKNIVPAGSDPDIVMHRSTNGGLNWSAGIRVNQDPINNGKYQWFPAIRVDEAGGVNIVYYDDRNTASDSSEIYLSRSINGGDNWTDALVSDHRFKPKSIGVSGIAAGYQGDYIGLTSGNSKLWPLWMDDAAGIYNAWTAGIQLANYPLTTFNLQTPPAGTRLVSFPNSTTPSTITWDTSASTATYKWIFGSPTTSPRKLTIPAGGNSLTVTAGQLDNLLAGLGLAQGDSLVGQWDVWAFRNNEANDSLKAANGPRAITLKRGIPALTAFNLNSPPTNTTVLTTPTDLTPVKPNWTRSGQGVKYKWIFASPTFTPANIKAIYQADNSGFDTTVSIRTSKLDSLAASLGVAVNDSLSGQWRVYAYSAADSLASAQTYNLKIRRLPITTVTIGNGTADESYPLNRFYNYYRWQGIYTGSEIGTNGTIRKIKFYQNNSVGGVTNDNMRIFMKVTTDSLLPTGGWDSTGMTQVFSGTTTSLAAPGWQEITLTTPIYLNSSQNLMIAICRDYLVYVSTYPRYAYTVMPGYKARRGQSDTQYPTSLTQSFNRPNVQFEIGLVTGISNNFAESIPFTYSLSQNYPNPFNPTTKINFSIPKQGLVSLKIYDVLGKEVMTLMNEQKTAGNYEVDFNGINLASGAYFYRLESGEFVDIKRMILVK